MVFSLVIAYLGSMVGAKNDAATLRLFADQALGEAESGAEVGMRAIRDDVIATFQTTTPSANGYCKNSSFDGNVSVGSGGSGTANNARTYENTSAGSYVLNSTGDTIEIHQFYQMVNFLGTRVNQVEVGCNYDKASSGGTDPSLILEYSTNGGGAWTTVSTTTVSSTSFAFLYSTIAGVNNWQTLFTDNFRVRARLNGGNRNINVDYLFLRITVELDANTEPWRTRSYITVPKNFSSGSVTGISIEDESGKVNINTATQSFLRNIMVEYGVVDATANTVATNIVTYRGGANGPFENVEELMQVTGMTTAIYNAQVTDPDLGARKLNQDLTVYSWINNQVQRTTGTRAPVNVNSASREVLKAVFDPLGLGATDPASLAADIVTQRATQPFGCIFTTNPDSNAFSLRQFVSGRAYLTAAEQNSVMENADASLTSWNGGNVVTAEFSCYSNSFMIQGTGQYPASSPRSSRSIKVLYGDVYNYSTFGFSTEGSLKIPVSTSETGYSGYWREQ